MPDVYSKNIIYLSKAQYQELVANQSITVSGQTITFNENDIYVTPQAEPITDVKINNVSIGSNGVANIPVADRTVMGVGKVANDYGIQRGSGGLSDYLITAPADSSLIKSGEASNQGIYKPITPRYQHESTFYGLAKAAGADMKDIANATVGTYPDTQKAAIQNMLGITDLISTEESTTATAAHALNSTFMMNGKLHRVTAAIAIGDAVEVGTNCEVVKADEVFVKKTDYATSTEYGIVKVKTAYGIGIIASGTYKGTLSIIPSDIDRIKNGVEGFRPIVPSYQHESVFYGLTKAAGVDLADVSNITVGTYPETSKAAIRTMLGAAAASDIPTVPVQDVQVNGTSVLSSGVANVPVASSSTVGAMKVDTTDGFQIVDDKLWLRAAQSGNIKEGTIERRAITPIRQHESTFYGLAKAAGDTTQSASDNAVGTYTDGAKAAIQSMLGITQTITVTAQTQDNVTVTGQTVYLREDDANGPIYASAAYEGQPVSFAVPSGFHYHISISDTLAHHFNPTTVSGIVTNASIAATITYSDFSSIASAGDIKAALNAGMDLTDLVGEQITCTRNNETLTWDVVDYDSTNKSIMLLLHDAFGSANMVFEPAQALMWCENGLAAGSYKFTVGTTVYYFTLTQAIPAGGQLVASDSGTFSTYASQSATATIETGTVSTTEITGATDLGTAGSGLLNHNSRVRYGSNNYAESALLWWLNSDDVANTQRVPVTKFSRAYSYNVPGFLYNLDSNFIDYLDDVEWKCSTNNVYECPQSLGGYTAGTGRAYTITKKIGLASEMEIFGSYGGNADGSSIFDLYNGASADDRKKYRGTSAQTWWLRSPIWSYAHYERNVYSSGNAYYDYANSSYAVVPACRISADEEIES